MANGRFYYAKVRNVIESTTEAALLGQNSENMGKWRRMRAVLSHSPATEASQLNSKLSKTALRYSPASNLLLLQTVRAGKARSVVGLAKVSITISESTYVVYVLVVGYLPFNPLIVTCRVVDPIRDGLP